MIEQPSLFDITDPYRSNDNPLADWSDPQIGHLLSVWKKYIENNP